jgi:glycosyltransferase involved in cell wall biosynthesis
MKVLVFPFDYNPYQEKLYQPLRRSGVQVRYLHRYPRIGALDYPFWTLLLRLRGYRLLHLHWPAFGLPTWLPRHRTLSLWFFLFCVRWTRLLGYRIVWTVHNVTPHEAETSDDLRAAVTVSRAATAKIVHSQSTLGEMRERGLDAERCTIIPQGNYIGQYPDTIDGTAARQQLGLEPTDFVFLYFGLLRPYKGVAGLIRAFSALPDQAARLVIAGRCMDPEVAELVSSADVDPRIVVVDSYIDDADVAAYYRACDIVCLPYLRVATSGSAMLALSFGKPVVASRVGDLANLPDGAGFLYEKDDPHGLEASLRTAITSRELLPAAGEIAYQTAANASWDNIARWTMQVYRDALSG